MTNGGEVIKNGATSSLRIVKQKTETNLALSLSFSLSAEEEEEDDDHEQHYEQIEVTNHQTPTPSNRQQNAPMPKYSDVNKPEPNRSTVTIDRTTRYIRPANSINNGTADHTHRQDISNSLHDALNRLKFENLAERDSIDEEGTEDILLRSKPFKQFSRNSQRGSSKVVCSMVSVRE